MKVLVTGAAGFIGSHLLDRLLERGDEVRAFVRPGENIGHLQTLANVEVRQGDLADAASLKCAVQGVQRVYHIAAKTGPWGPEKVFTATNVQGLTDLIFAAMDAGVQRIVHTSSITVYGHHLRGIVTEDCGYHIENNPYSRSKIAGEMVVFKLVRTHGAPVVMVRPAWVYGPRDNASFGRLVSRIEKHTCFIIGNGANIVPVVYVRDVAQGIIKAGDAGNQVVGQAYTIADDRYVTQIEYLNTIAGTLQVAPVSRRIPFSPIHFAGRTAETLWKAVDRRKVAPPPLTTYGVTLLGRNQQFSVEKARRDLGYVPEYDVKRGVAEGIAWYRATRQANPQRGDGG
jgi:nucleoside-diphosphate-sugar epimerase